MRPYSSRQALGVALVLSLASLGGCQTHEKPEPKKVESENPFDRRPKPVPEDPNSPLRNPHFEAPLGREGEQIPEAEIEAALAEAAKEMAVENVAGARSILGRCANKTPANARCDGEMGLAMVDAKNRRAAALYYLTEAAKLDDPKADAGFYARLGEALRSQGKYEEALSALEKAIARDPSAENLFALGRALSLRPERVREAAARIAEARAKDDRLDWLYEEAVLRGQIPIREEALAAVALIEDYVKRDAALPEAERRSADDIKALEARAVELKSVAPGYLTAEAWEAKQAADAAATSAAAAATGDGGAADADAAPAPADGAPAEPAQPR